MVRIKVIIILVFTTFLSVSKGQPPYWEQTRGPGGSVEKLVFDSAENIYALGEKIWRSTDDGVHWVNVTPKKSLGSFSGLAVSPDGTIYVGEKSDGNGFRYSFNVYRSTDKGNSWQVILSDYLTSDIKARTGAKVYLSGHRLGTDDNHFLISSDSGNHWSSGNGYPSLPALDAKQISLGKNGYVFLDYNYAIDPYFYRSSDDGENWTKLITNDVGGNGLICSADNQLYTSAPTKYNPNSGYIGGAYKSTDNGRTWNLLNPFSTRGIGVTSNGDLYIADELGISFSSDKGVSWKRIGVVNNDPWRTMSANFSGSRVYATDYNRSVILAPDSMNWIERTIPCSKVYFIAPDILGSVAALVEDPGGLALSLNKGDFWRYRAPILWGGSISYSNLWRIGFDSSGGLLGSKDEDIWRSTDGGYNWVLFKKSMPTLTYKTAPNGSIFTFTQKNEIYRTNDLGKTWDMMSSFGSRKPYAIDCSIDGNIYASAGGALFRSSDNGDSWRSVINFMDKDLNISLGPKYSSTISSLVCTSKNEIIASYQVQLILDSVLTKNGYQYTLKTENGIIKSTDKGVSWAKINLGLNNDIIRDLTSGFQGEVYAFSNRALVIYLGYNDSIWTSINSGLDGINDFTCMTVGNGGSVFIGTQGRGIYRKILTLDYVEKQPVIKTNLVSLSVFPNPFSSKSTISYALKESIFVKLDLCDVTGRTISTIVNEGQHPKLYEYPLNLSNFDDGMYLVRLVTSEGISVVKAIVIK